MTFSEITHFESLEAAVRSIFGNNTTIAEKTRVGGGDINDAFRLLLTDGTVVFMKSNPAKDITFFDAEAQGLLAIAATNTIHVPKVISIGSDGNLHKNPFLLLEFIQSGKKDRDYWSRLAVELARMHEADTASFCQGGMYGFGYDNFIGERPQKNTPHTSWIAFFRDCRLAPQLKSAAHYFDMSDIVCAEKLLEKLDDILIEPKYPSLLHGDLWGGNAIAGVNSTPFLIDPAVYVGCREADIAMTELFGGFAQAFYDTYRQEAPLDDGYSRRRDIYNLYHLLNHLNIFGRSYLAPVINIIRRVSAK